MMLRVQSKIHMKTNNDKTTEITQMYNCVQFQCMLQVCAAQELKAVSQTVVVNVM